MSLIVNEQGVTYDVKLPKAIVLYRYEATEDEEISLEEGSYIDIVEEASDGWWRGFTISKDRKEGIFPFNYVRKLSKNETEAWKQKMVVNNNNGNNSNGSNISIVSNGNSSGSNSNINIDQAQQSTLRDSSTSNSSSSSLSVNHNNNTNNSGNNSGIRHSNSSTNPSGSTSNLPTLEPTETHYIASLSDPIEKQPTETSENNTPTRITSLPPTPPLPLTPPPSTTPPSTAPAPTPSSQTTTPSNSFPSTPTTIPPTITIRLDDISKEGYLTKKGHIRRNWNIRWFQLRRNVLTYAKTPKDPKLSGELYLTPDTQVDIATSMKRTNCFQIRIPNHQNTKSELILQCSAQSPDDMESWINAINQAKVFIIKPLLERK